MKHFIVFCIITGFVWWFGITLAKVVKSIEGTEIAVIMIIFCMIYCTVLAWANFKKELNKDKAKERDIRKHQNFSKLYKK